MTLDHFHGKAFVKGEEQHSLLAFQGTNRELFQLMITDVRSQQAPPTPYETLSGL